MIAGLAAQLPSIPKSGLSRPPVVGVAPPHEANLNDQSQLSPSALGEPAKSTQERFRDFFFQDYEARFCGKNIKRFVVSAPNPQELAGAKVIAIENKGNSWFGMVRAMHARDVKGNGEPYATDRNWYHHVILEKDGRIYDFDYGIQPQLPSVQEYFETMFLKCDKVRPAEKLDQYHLQVIDAQEYATGAKDSSTTMSMREYLEGWGVNAQTYLVQSRAS